MYRGVSVSTSGIDDFAVEFIYQRVGQTWKVADQKTIRRAGSTRDRLAIASPLVFNISLCSSSNSGKGHDVLLTSVFRSNNVSSYIIDNSQDNLIGIIDMIVITNDAGADHIGSNRIVLNRKGCTCRICRSAIDVPSLACNTYRRKISIC